jgi:hypothetical protein
MAELVSGNPSAICGEAASGTTLLPLQGDAFAWKFQVPIGAEMTESYELETTDGLQRVTAQKKTAGKQPRIFVSSYLFVRYSFYTREDRDAELKVLFVHGLRFGLRF